MKIAVVTDSTCDWPYAEYAERNVFMVPLNVSFGERVYHDQTELPSEQFCSLMRSSGEFPTTSQPSPGAFSRLFGELYDQGYDAALCLHLASPLSGTVQSALIAAADSPLDVRVVDSHLAASALGIAVDAACRLRDAGVSSIDEMQQRIEELCASTKIFLVPETLDALVRGGRLAADAAEQMGLLNVRAILTLDKEGRVVFFDKARGLKGAIARCIEELEAFSDEHGAVDVRYAHVANEDAAKKLISALNGANADIACLAADTCGATIASHLGLGAWCVAMAPRMG